VRSACGSDDGNESLMASVTRVPQTRTMDGSELSADDARATVRDYGRMTLVKNAFIRFRYADGFSHSRAMALQLVLSLIPLGIAFVGLSGTVQADRLGRVLQEVLLRITPGSTDQLVRQTLRKGGSGSGSGNELALWIGLAVALVALTTAMGQVERGANRIYGIQRDRPALHKYGRAVLMACSAGLLSLVGFLVIVAGGTVGDVLTRTYGWSHTQHVVWDLARYPVGIVLALGAFTLLIERSPRRRQPGWSWIAIGAGVALVLWLVFTYALSLYIQTSGSFGSTYGPLTGVIALLLWANLTSVALFLGIAFSAQLEAVRAGVRDPERGDPEKVRRSDDTVVATT
jgi:YihY family inner membrane protein